MKTKITKKEVRDQRSSTTGDAIEHIQIENQKTLDSTARYIGVTTCGAGIAERVSALDWPSLRFAAIITLRVSNPGLCP